MRPLVNYVGMPASIDELAVEWDRLVIGDAPLDPELPYLAALRALTNTGPRGGVFAHQFRLRGDAELDRLLDYVPSVTALQREVVPRTLARTAARARLAAFGDATLEHQLVEAELTYTSPFLLEGMLAEYLFWYGIYEHFYEHATATQAVALARDFLATLGADDLEVIVPFMTRLPWGAWFDPHSVSDATLAVFHRGRRELTVCCFSHSD